jgi:PAS domain S-box-containing protein
MQLIPWNRVRQAGIARLLVGNIGITGLTRQGVLALLAGLGLSALAAGLQSYSNREFTHQALKTAVHQASEQIVARLHLYQYGLRGARGAVLTAGENRIDPRIFQRYSQTRSLAEEFPGARGFGFVRRVPDERLDAYLRKQHSEGRPAFALHQLGVQPPTRGGEYLVIELFEPSADNEQAMGLDIGSEKNRREAALASMASNQPRLTAPITLVQAQGRPEQSFLLLMPVYRSADAPSSPEARMADGFGWTFTPLLMEEVLGSLQLDDDSRHLRVTDITSPDYQPVLYASQGEFKALASAVAHPEIFGRLWQVEVTANAAFVRHLHLLSPAWVMGIGALLSALLAAFLSAFEIGRLRRRQAQAAQGLMAAIVESSTDAIIARDLEGRVTSWNKGAEYLLGYSAEEAVGQPLTRLIVPAALLAEERALLAQVSTGQPVQLDDARRQNKAGRSLDVSISASPVYDSNGQVIAISSSLRDISGQKAAEAQVREINANLEELVNQRTLEVRRLNALFGNVLRSSSEVSIIATDLQGVISVFNRGAERMLGYSAEEMIGQAPLTLLHLPTEIEQRAAQLSVEYAMPLDGLRALVHQAEVQGSDTREWTYRRKDGSQLQVSLVMTAMRDDDSALTGYLGIAVDVTAQHALEAGLMHAKEQADAASAAKSHFLANMSHEIRTPMNAVLGMLQLINHTPLNPRQEDYVSKAQSAARSLLGILNDILDYSKIEAGKLQLDVHAFELENLMQDLAVVLAGNQVNAKVEVVFDIDPGLPPALLGDSLRLQQILINLGGNALKFTAQGHVVVSVQALRQDARRVSVRIAVSDSGIGIDASQIQRIFEGFSQAETSTSRRFGGTGLGLVISRRLLQLMGSELHVESEPGVGSRFWFDVELGIDAHVAAPSPALLALDRRIKLLVVDDNDVAAHILTRTLLGLGWQADHLTDSRHVAARVVSAQQAGAPYDALLMDWKMPGSDGLSTAREVQRECLGFKAPAIIMITAYGREVLADAREAGDPPFVELLAKPVTPRQLRAAVHKALDANPDRLPERLLETPALLARLHGVRLLVVEDNALNRFVAFELLRREGAEVQLVEGGLQALETIAAHPRAIDLVLMDVQMPDLDGLEVTRRLRAAPASAHLPIVAMTANASTADRDACLAAGMNDHIGKPIDIDHVVEVVRRYLPAMVLEELDGPMPGLEASSAIIDRFGGDGQLFRGALAYFDVEIASLLDRLEEAMAEPSQRRAADVLHSIKGCAATMGAQALATLAGNLEPRVRALDAPAAIAGSIDLAQLRRLSQDGLQALHELAENGFPRA